MAIVRHTVGKELTPEELAAMEAQVEAAARRPYVYDPDSPLLTKKQLSEFCPLNFKNMKERAQAMQNQEHHAFIQYLNSLPPINSRRMLVPGTYSGGMGVKFSRNESNLTASAYSFMPGFTAFKRGSAKYLKTESS